MRAFPSIQTVRPQVATEIPEPPVARLLFADTRMGVIWLVVRLYAAYEWLTAGWEKLTGVNLAFGADFGHYDAKTQWVFNGSNGTAMKGFVTFALSKAPGGKLASTHPDVQGWYGAFLKDLILPNVGFFSYVITFGEVLVGLGLLVGALTGIAAFFGLFMNLNFMLAGAVSINPILGIACLLLVLAWRVAGYYGVDRYLLPLLGTPWTGTLANQEKVSAKGARLAAS